MLLPSESIKNFAHRLNNLAATVYSDIQDDNAKDRIKFMKFISSIPSNIRIKLQEEGIDDYNAAVARAQTLQEILYNEKILYAGPSTSTSNDLPFAEQLQKISEKLNNLTFKADNEHNCQFHNNEGSNKRNSSSFKHRKQFKAKNNFKRYSPHRSPKHKTPRCQLCSKYGHDAKSCFKWKRLNTQKHSQYKSRNEANSDFQEN